MVDVSVGQNMLFKSVKFHQNRRLKVVDWHRIVKSCRLKTMLSAS